jgi:hypothetical protein
VHTSIVFGCGTGISLIYYPIAESVVVRRTAGRFLEAVVNVVEVSKTVVGGTVVVTTAAAGSGGAGVA